MTDAEVAEMHANFVFLVSLSDVLSIFCIKTLTGCSQTSSTTPVPAIFRRLLTTSGNVLNDIDLHHLETTSTGCTESCCNVL